MVVKSDVEVFGTGSAVGCGQGLCRWSLKKMKLQLRDRYFGIHAKHLNFLTLQAELQLRHDCF
jgi:hypothetical protein